MTVMYTIYNSENEGNGATIIFSDGTVEPVDASNPNFAEIVSILTSPDKDEERLRFLIAPIIGVATSLTRLSERVSYDGTNRTLLFDGDPLDGSIAEHILRILNEGGNSDSYSALVAFLEKLAQNPSEKSRQSLYDFIRRHNITIDPDGDFYVYKGVRADGKSVHSGFGIVNGVTMNGHLPNEPGSIIEIPRSKVDADTSIGCSTGLHVGSYAYASSFAQGKLLTAKVNPRDVVSVPDDCSYQKIRVSRYKVVTSETVQMKSTTFTFGDDEEDYNNISTVEYLLGYDVKIPASFTLKRGTGDGVEIEGFIVDTYTNRNNEVFLVVAEDETTEETKFYNFSLISNLSIDEGIIEDFFGSPEDENEWKEDYHDDDADDVDSADLDIFLDEPDLGIENLVDDVVNNAPQLPLDPFQGRVLNGQEVADFLLNNVTETSDFLIDFDYVTVQGEARSLKDFSPTEIRRGNRYNLLVGEREDGETRNYRLDRISNLKVI